MLKAHRFYVCGLLALLIGGITPQLTGQTARSVGFSIFDMAPAVAENYITSPATKRVTINQVFTQNQRYNNNQGCTYNSCFNASCQCSTGDCQQNNCVAVADCGCAEGGIAATGCRSQRGCFGRFDRIFKNKQEYFQYPDAPSCPGDRLYSMIETQKANGRIAQLVFYNFHFSFGSGPQQWSLSPAGQNNVFKLSRILSMTQAPIIVEPSGDAAADKARVQVVQAAMARSIGSAIPIKVVVANTPSVGLGGIEAGTIYQERLLNAPLILGSSSSTGSSAGAIDASPTGR